MPEITAPDHEVHIGTTGGASVHLKAGETRQVPAYIAALAAQAGCNVTHKAPAKPAHTAIERVLQAMIKEGNPEEFNKGGRPKPGAVSARLGAEVTAAEIQPVWQAVSSVNGPVAS